MAPRHAMAVLALAVAAVTAQAGDDKTASPPQAAGDQLQGKRVVRDRDTGRLRAPTDDELRQLLDAERAARQARGEPEPTGRGAPLRVRQHPDGMRSAVLGPDYLVTLKAERQPDGRVSITHGSADSARAPAAPRRPTE